MRHWIGCKLLKKMDLFITIQTVSHPDIPPSAECSNKKAKDLALDQMTTCGIQPGSA